MAVDDGWTPEQDVAFKAGKREGMEKCLALAEQEYTAGDVACAIQEELDALEKGQSCLIPS